MLDYLKEVMLEALIDSVKVLPFILIIYIIMELIESAKKKEKIEKALGGGFAPLVAGALGIVPECGFSVGLAKLFDNGLIKFGTLITAFIATSDEGLVVMISGGAPIKDIIIFVVWKVVFAIIIGEILNAIFKNFGINHVCPEEDDCVECGEHHGKRLDKFFIHPLVHALKTLVFIFICNVIFGSFIFFIGEEAFVEFVGGVKYLQPVLASIIGLIPNCASSIVLTEAYLNSALSLSGLIAGLSTNAGLGLLILFRNKKNVKRNVIIILTMFTTGILSGYLSMLFI